MISSWWWHQSWWHGACWYVGDGEGGDAHRSWIEDDGRSTGGLRQAHSWVGRVAFGCVGCAWVGSVAVLVKGSERGAGRVRELLWGNGLGGRYVFLVLSGWVKVEGVRLEDMEGNWRERKDM